VNLAVVQLKILESSGTSLESIAQSMEEEPNKRNEEEVIVMTDEMQCKKGCQQMIAQTLSANKLRKLQQGTDLLQGGSEVGSVTGGALKCTQAYTEAAQQFRWRTNDDGWEPSTGG
jgi:hypothetical protein